MIEVWSGDGFSIENHNLMGKVNHYGTMTPSGSKTWEYHFGMIADPVFGEQGDFVDFETRESISKGPATLRFFKQYRDQVVTMYRIPDMTEKQSLEMLRYVSEIGERPYGYKDFLEAGLDVSRLLLTLNLPPYTADQLRVSQNDDYLCTELYAYAARRAGRPVEAPGRKRVWDIPVVYLQAEEEGRLKRYYKGLGSQLYQQVKAFYFDLSLRQKFGY